MEHRKLSCSEIQEYIDGLSQRQFQAKIENSPECEHIQQCVTCREYYDRAKGLSEKLDQWSVPNLKHNITAGVMAQIAQLERDRKIDHFNLWSRFPALFARRLKVPAGGEAVLGSIHQGSAEDGVIQVALADMVLRNGFGGHDRVS